MLSNDAAARRADAATLEPPDLLERVTGGIRLLADPGLRRVVLAPSYFSRPYNFVFSANEWRLFCYPIADASLDGAEGSAPPPQIVRLYRALGDESRMRILKLLTERDHYLTELAQELELSKPTVKHHLTQLRAAGVVTMTEEGSLTYYSLRRQRLEEAGVELDRYLS
jgi:DNA-binding transcriptional ArsR family regulator